MDLPSISLRSRINFLLFILVIASGARLQLPKMMLGMKAKRIVDFRSDTVTKPTQAMRKAIFDAEVGDDVFGEDPSINNLEERMANLFGKPKALFFPTGTMSNLAASLSWCQSRGSEMILGDKSHIHIYEQGGVSQFGGIATHILPNREDGTMDLGGIKNAIRKNNIHFPVTELIAIENTHNDCGGKVLPFTYMQELSALCKEHQIPLHLDGARIWNAAVASGMEMAKLVEPVDSISACLSKGLGAPVGSVLIGPEAMISRARRIRKALGGGMRQAGVLAAAGLKALDDFESGMIENDHRRAKVLGEALAKIPGIRVDPSLIQTNIILVKIEEETWDSSVILNLLKEEGILALPKGPKAFRIVLHRDINDEDIEYSSRSMHRIFEKLSTTLTSKTTSENVDVIDIHVNEMVKPRVEESVPNKEFLMEELESHAMISPALTSPLINISSPPTSSTSSTSPVLAIPPTASVAPEDLALINYLSNPYEAAFVCGMSVSDDGFCVFLQGSISDRVIKVPVNPLDPLVDGLDRDQVESSEAVTLLQLLQGIDVETYLPKDALQIKFNDPKQKYRLRRVMIHNLSPFLGTLYGSPKKVNQTIDTSSFNTSTFMNLTPPELPLLLPSVSSAADELLDKNFTYAISTILQQDSGGVTTEATAGNYSSEITLSQPELDAIFPFDLHKISSVSMNLRNVQRLLQCLAPNLSITSPFSSFVSPFSAASSSSSSPSSSSTTTTTTASPPIITKEITNAYESLALALRHTAYIEIKSDLFYHEQLSYQDITEVLSEYPTLLQPTILTFEEKQQEIRNLIIQDLGRSQRYLDLLSRQLIEAFRQQKEMKYAMILSTLEFILQQLHPHMNVTACMLQGNARSTITSIVTNNTTSSRLSSERNKNGNIISSDGSSNNVE